MNPKEALREKDLFFTKVLLQSIKKFKGQEIVNNEIAESDEKFRDRFYHLDDAIQETLAESGKKLTELAKIFMDAASFTPEQTGFFQLEPWMQSETWEELCQHICTHIARKEIYHLFPKVKDEDMRRGRLSEDEWNQYVLNSRF